MQLIKKWSFVVFTLKGNQYIDMKTPDIHKPSPMFANPDYFNETQQQQQRAAAKAPTTYFNV